VSRACALGEVPLGSAWTIGTDTVSGGYGIYTWNGSTWVSRAPFGATRIAVDPVDTPWVCDSAGAIKRRQGTTWTTYLARGATLASARPAQSGSSARTASAGVTESISGMDPHGLQWTEAARGSPRSRRESLGV
jgi:hypothetical protein